jgi:hypothetical protein
MLADRKRGLLVNAGPDTWCMVARLPITGRRDFLYLFFFIFQIYSPSFCKIIPMLMLSFQTVVGPTRFKKQKT